MANEENLISLGDRTTSEQREISKKGGIASGEARREKKIASEAYAELLAEEHDVKIDGEKTKVSGKNLLKRVIIKILINFNSSSVAMIKEIREATEGNKLTVKMDPKDIPVTLEDLEEILNDD